eukprot:scaffold92226_cov15-Tisochrysis_lutea.AAC.1
MARNTREAALALSTTADIAEHLPSEDLRGQFGPGYTRTPNEFLPMQPGVTVCLLIVCEGVWFAAPWPRTHGFHPSHFPVQLGSWRL